MLDLVYCQDSSVLGLVKPPSSSLYFGLFCISPPLLFSRTCISCFLSSFVTMSSVFSFDNWDSLLDAAAPSVSGSDPSPSSSAAVDTPSSVTSSGEFLPFVSVGASLAGGGGGKVFSLFYPGTASTSCLGMIGSAKFCLKDSDGGMSCGIQAHLVKKASLESDAFYLKENNGRAFLKPKFSAPGLDSKVIDFVLSKALSLKEWEMFFEELNRGVTPAVMVDCGFDLDDIVNETVSNSDEEKGELNDSGLKLISPKVMTDSLGIFKALPTLSFEDDALEEDASIPTDRRNLFSKNFNGVL